VLFGWKTVIVVGHPAAYGGQKAGRVLNRKANSDTETAPERESDALAGRAADRFEKRRGDIIAAAIPVLNGQGFKGMRLTEVAELIGLRATGVTYYFPRKEELAVACLESGMAVFHELLAVAEHEPSARARVSRLIHLFVERDAAVRRGEATPLTSFSSLRSLEGDHFKRVSDAYKVMFRRVRALFESPELGHLEKPHRSVRALILLEQLYWAQIWLGDYDLDEFPRLAQRIEAIALNGLIEDGPVSGDMKLDASAGAKDASKENFLRAATRQINAYGYRGASVDRISASLNLTKGAFYHHNEAKDELVAACFRRSFGLIREAQRLVRGQGPNEAWRLKAAVAALVRFQIGGEGPLLRTSVMSSMPRELQAEIMSASYRASRQFTSMVADGIADGSARPVDAAVAGAMVHAAVNVASDLLTIRGVQKDEALVREYVRVLFGGLLKP
jgi:AcrR family transcriptional regulator